MRLFSVAEGEIGELHVGLKGTMNALFLKDLALKTHRGLEGRVRQGRSGGGLCFGYDVVRELDASGNPVRGQRAINQEEAATIIRIYEEFASGRSPVAIAKHLNSECVKGPRGKDWGPSTIYGNWKRGTGILNNDLYVGRLVWNRQHFIKDPDSGKRQARPNPETQWVIEEVPSLRIVPQHLWDAVKERQNGLRRTMTSPSDRSVRSERAKRAVYLFSGLLKCGECNGSYSMVNATSYGCSTRKTRGTCTNNLLIKRLELENLVLEGLKKQLMEPSLVKEFIKTYHQDLNQQLAGETNRRERLSKQLRKVTQELEELISAVKSGIRSKSLQTELEMLEDKQQKLEDELKTEPPPPIRLHPNLAEIYRNKVQNLADALNAPDTRQEAGEILRSLIEEIWLVPQGKELDIHLKGELAEMLAISTNQKPGSIGTGLKITLVAGGRYPLHRKIVWFRQGQVRLE